MTIQARNQAPLRTHRFSRILLCLGLFPAVSWGFDCATLLGKVGQLFVRHNVNLEQLLANDAREIDEILRRYISPSLPSPPKAPEIPYSELPSLVGLSPAEAANVLKIATKSKVRFFLHAPVDDDRIRYHLDAGLDLEGGAHHSWNKETGHIVVLHGKVEPQYFVHEVAHVQFENRLRKAMDSGTYVFHRPDLNPYLVLLHESVATKRDILWQIRRQSNEPAANWIENSWPMIIKEASYPFWEAYSLNVSNYLSLYQMAVDRHGRSFEFKPRAAGIIQDLNRLKQVEIDITNQYIDFTLDMFESLRSVDLKVGSKARAEVEEFNALRSEVDSETFDDQMDAWIYRNCPYLRKRQGYIEVIAEGFKKRFRAGAAR